MSGRLQLGFQVSVLSLRSPTYGRLELSARQAFRQNVSVTQAEELALEAERRLGRRPLRRTDSLAQRLEQDASRKCSGAAEWLKRSKSIGAKLHRPEVQQLVKQTAQELVRGNKQPYQQEPAA